VPAPKLVVTPAIEAPLNDRQKRILAEALRAGTVTRRWCVTEFKVANDTAGRDLKTLVELRLLETQGKGRGVRYTPASAAESTGKRPTR